MLSQIVVSNKTPEKYKIESMTEQEICGYFEF